MKSLTCTNPLVSMEYGAYPIITDMLKRLNVANEVLKELESRGAMSGTELDKLVEEKLGDDGYSIRPFLDGLAHTHENVRSEVRAEEMLYIRMKDSAYGKIYRTHDPKCVIFINSRGRTNPTLIYNPNIRPDSIERDGVLTGYIQGNRYVQVRRKYYVWVE